MGVKERSVEAVVRLCSSARRRKWATHWDAGKEGGSAQIKPSSEETIEQILRVPETDGHRRGRKGKKATWVAPEESTDRRKREATA